MLSSARSSWESQDDSWDITSMQSGSLKTTPQDSTNGWPNNFVPVKTINEPLDPFSFPIMSSSNPPTNSSNDSFFVAEQQQPISTFDAEVNPFSGGLSGSMPKVNDYMKPQPLAPSRLIPKMQQKSEFDFLS